MGLNLSNSELEAMDGLPHLHRCLYIFGIRRYMDYTSGVVGIKRKISYKSLSEEIYVAPRSGIKEVQTRSVAQLKRAVKQLEKAGLIIMQSKVTKDEKQLILKCALATTDERVKNKAVPRPYHSPVLEAVPDTATKENQENLYKNSVIQHGAIEGEESKSRTESRPTQFKKAVQHPLSGKDTILNYTKPPVDNFLSIDENRMLNLFFDLRLSLKLAGDLKAIVAAKALVQAGVTLEEAKNALEIKLAGYTGDRTPHPSYFTQAILDYKRDLDAIKNQSEVTHEHNRQRPVLQSKTDSRRDRYKKILR